MLSKTVSLLEATKSDTAIRLGIDNTPNAVQIENMRLTSEQIVDKVRDKFPGTIINSFFRCEELNTAIGGSKTSDHRHGNSVDLDSKDNKNNLAIFNFIKDNLVFDQCILEYPDKNGVPSWIHASRRLTGNRKEVLVKLKTKYIKYSDYKVGMV